ncbi:nitrate- and nitrite sensing domain-containing protein [Candidatus Sodalis sp. SoCistrobi]|uniref:nitrate- and nitrite sensing domain-containing protein n=1 Tax=Candidatus Sodalis sp. SoCistrobi TaxID=1922216 RepID=UPI00093B5F59|nr:nitrate- and nitrite sensing domain-containing protein [Candidatus Sodalis sp. SoCistrobi]
MKSVTPSARHFSELARATAIAELNGLLQTGRLINRVSQLIDALQLERGTSNIWLSSGGRLFDRERGARTRHALQARQEADIELAALAQRPAQSGGARLFHRAARALTALETLPALREGICRQTIAAPAAMSAFTAVIRQLLSLIFDAADAATEPAVSRAMIALFSFMQGKELAGQERALGAAGFARGTFDDAERQQLTTLIEGQSRCFATFSQFAAEDVLGRWTAQRFDNAEFERLRRIACTQSRPEIAGEESALRWFALHTRRMNDLKQVQSALEAALMDSCRVAISQAEQQETSPVDAAAAPEDGAFQIVISPLEETPSAALPPDFLSPQLSRSVLSLAQQQSLRLQQLGQELATLRAGLEERKIIDKAKALLIRQRKLSEEQAYQTLRTLAMNQNKRVVDIAAALLAIADVL